MHPTIATASPEKPPQKARLPLSADGRGIFPPADSFQTKELGAEPVTVQGFEGWTPEGFDSHPRTTESGTAMGKPIYGRGPSKQSLGMP